jgi:serine kinase of HPr protein (carbohydrate metabolism regulator)
MSKPQNIHGTGLVLGQTGILLRGPSGAGKSVLALALLDRWEGRGLTALLVSDDRVDVAVDGVGLTMQAPPAIAGLIELRGRGIVRRSHLDGVRLHLVIDLVDDFVRMLEDEAMTTDLLGVPLARAPVPRAGIAGLGHQVLLVAEAVSALQAPAALP